MFHYLSSRYYIVPNFNESICLNFSVESKFSKSRFEVFFFSWTDVSLASNSSEQHTLLLQLQKSRTTCFTCFVSWIFKIKLDHFIIKRQLFTENLYFTVSDFATDEIARPRYPG